MDIKSGNKFKYAAKENFEDLSSGRVIYGASGATNFPVRLINEIFMRAIARLTKQGITPPYSIYDPFCGAGYSMTVLGFLHGNVIKNIFVSDVDKTIIKTADKNLSLLANEGFNNRTKELIKLKEIFNKTSHDEALISAKHLKEKVPNIKFEVFEFNILGNKNFPILKESIDLVISDLPYGQLTKWEGENGSIDPFQTFLSNIGTILKPKGIVAISSDKKQKLLYNGYSRVEKFRLGKRQVIFLTKE